MWMLFQASFISENETVSNEYLSALDVSHDSSSPSQCSEVSPKKAKIDNMFVPLAEDNMEQPPNETQNDIADDSVDEEGSPPKTTSAQQPTEECKSEPNIPPAFASFLDSLSKKRPRSTPKSLPVRSLYDRERSRPTNDNARYPSHLPRFSFEKKSEDGT